MASVQYGDAIYGLRDIKVTNIGGTVQEDLGAASMLEFAPVFDGGRLIGDDAWKAILSYIVGAEGNIRAGQFSSAALSIMTGITLTTSGTTPNEITTLKLSAGDRMPYFKVYGQALDEGAGDMHILASKVKLTSLKASKLENGNWRLTEATVDLVDDGSNGIFKQIQDETAAAVPAS